MPSRTIRRLESVGRALAVIFSLRVTIMIVYRLGSSSSWKLTTIMIFIPGSFTSLILRTQYSVFLVSAGRQWTHPPDCIVDSDTAQGLHRDRDSELGRYLECDLDVPKDSNTEGPEY